MFFFKINFFSNTTIKTTIIPNKHIMPLLATLYHTISGGAIYIKESNIKYPSYL